MATRKIDSFDSLLFHIEHGSFKDVVSIITSHPEWIDQTNALGSRPLHYAAWTGRDSIVRLLAGARSGSIDIPNKNGETPLIWAAWSGRTSTVRLLLKFGSKSLDIPDRHGNTALFYTVSGGHISTAELLLKCGSLSFDTPNNNELTPLLLCAAMSNKSSIVELLLKFGCESFNMPNNDGYTPIYKFVLNGAQDAVRILKAVGASTNINLTRLNDSQIQLLREPMDDDSILEIRFRIYFERSLLQRLLDC